MTDCMMLPISVECQQPSSPASSIERGADRCFQAARNVLLRAGPTNPVPSLNLVSGHAGPEGLAQRIVA